MKRDISRRERLTVLVGEPSRVNLGKAAVRGGGGVIHCSLIQDVPGKNIRSLSEFLNPFASKSILQIISVCQNMCICYVSRQYLAIASVCDQ